jgi:uncharacterized protein (TIGR02757 family)
LYEKYNRKRWVHPDPLELLFPFENPDDREIVGLIASSLAYGRVLQIRRSIERVLERMPSPRRDVERATPKTLKAALKGFRHRFTAGDDVAILLLGVRKALRRFGSLNACFISGLDPSADSVLPALARFVEAVFPAPVGGRFSLLPNPGTGSACKRLNLFLRWMVRKDGVDPGGWSGVDPSLLVVPLDTHMHRICMGLGLTRRKQANLQAALEITDAFRIIAPDDPVRYDFCLTRLGIRNDADPVGFLKELGLEKGTIRD